jgi:hypothetical protein
MMELQGIKTQSSTKKKKKKTESMFHMNNKAFVRSVTLTSTHL